MNIELPEVLVKAKYPYADRVYKIANNSNANFIKRLKDINRKTIQDWNNEKSVATHKLSYAYENGKYFVYPEVQEINGQLHDFTDPKYNHEKWDSFTSALKNKDYIIFDNENDARYFTSGYKLYYPSFNYNKKLIQKNQYGNKIYKLSPEQRQDSINFMNTIKPFMARDKNNNIIGENEIYNNIRQTVDILGESDFSNPYIAGILGNIGIESKFDPNAKEIDGDGEGLFQYTPLKGTNNNPRNDAYENWLKENNLKNNFVNNIYYLRYIWDKEQNRVERINKAISTVRKIQKAIPETKVYFGENYDQFIKAYTNKNDTDPTRAKKKKLVSEFLSKDNLVLDDVRELEKMQDKDTWIRRWNNNWKYNNDTKTMKGSDSRILYKKVDSENPISTDTTTERFMDYFERPKDENNHLKERQKIARLLLPYVRLFRRYD